MVNTKNDDDGQHQEEEEIIVIRKSIAVDAASLGRLTRLQETIVETCVSDDDKADSDSTHHQDGWKLKRASQIELEKSTMYRCIQEAVSIGLLTESSHSQKKEDALLLSSQHSSSSFSSFHLWQNGVDKPIDGSRSRFGNDSFSRTSLSTPPVRRKKTLGQRASDLMEAHLRNLYDEKVLEGWTKRSSTTTTTTMVVPPESWETEIANEKKRRHNLPSGEAGCEDDSTASCSLTSTTTSSSLLYSSLPSPIVPRWRKRFSGMSKEKLKECVALEAATQALDRTWRLEYQTHQELIVRNGCTCVYCSDHPSPHQTQEYQRLRYTTTTTSSDHPTSSALWPAFVNLNDDPIMPSSSSLDPPSLETICGHPVPRLEHPQAIKDTLDQIIREAASKAWDRSLRLQKKGKQHVVKDRCRCSYCRTASPAQTQQYRRLQCGGGDAGGAREEEEEKEAPNNDITGEESLISYNSDFNPVRKLHLDGDLDEEQMLLAELGLLVTL